MKSFGKDLKEHATKIINYDKKKKKKKKPLTIEEDKSFQEQNISYICKKEFSIDDKK